MLFEKASETNKKANKVILVRFFAIIEVKLDLLSSILLLDFSF